MVDLERVFEAMGWTDEIRKNLQDSQAQVTTQLDPIIRPARENYEQKRDAVSKAAKLTPAQIEQFKNAKQITDLEKLGLTKAQIDDLTTALSNFAGVASQAQARMSQVMQSQQQAVVRAYQKAIEPAVRRIAAANGRSMIVTPSSNLIYVEPGSDLTDKVIDDLQHTTPLKVVLPPTPRIDLSAMTLPTTRP